MVTNSWLVLCINVVLYSGIKLRGYVYYLTRDNRRSLKMKGLCSKPGGEMGWSGNCPVNECVLIVKVFAFI